MQNWSTQLVAFAPILIVAVTLMIVMLQIVLKRSNFWTAILSVIGLNLAFLTLLVQGMAHAEDVRLAVLFTPLIGLASQLGLVLDPPIIEVSQLFIIDGFAQFNMGLVLVATLACFTLTYAYIESYNNNKEELYLLMMVSCMGAMLMASSQHLASFFMSLELLSIPIYAMLAYTHERSRSLESGIKYLVMSAAASATLLMGMALMYAYTGTLLFKDINLSVFYSLDQPLLILGAALMVFAIAFKLSLVPFHVWTADVYQGAPAPVTTFLATVSKVAMVALSLRFLMSTAVLAIPTIETALVVIAVLSMLVGNLLAIRQTNLKRLLGYSSIAHLGYVLAAIISLGPASAGITNLYMAVYVVTSIGAFGVITLMSSPYRYTEDAGELREYQGLFWRRPILTAVMTVMLLSLAGIPLTAGFISKFMAVLATVQAQSWLLAAMIIIGSAIGLYYYLRVMVTLFKAPIEAGDINFDVQHNWGTQMGGVMVILAIIATLYYGVFPEGLIELAQISRITILRS